MKKKLISIAIASILIGIFITVKLRNRQHVNDLFLINIECLATPENPNIRCMGYGSVDCPVGNIKVIYFG